jgi:hypothetical protein
MSCWRDLRPAVILRATLSAWFSYFFPCRSVLSWAYLKTFSLPVRPLWVYLKTFSLPARPFLGGTWKLFLAGPSFLGGTWKLFPCRSVLSGGGDLKTFSLPVRPFGGGGGGTWKLFPCRSVLSGGTWKLFFFHRSPNTLSAALLEVLGSNHGRNADYPHWGFS